MEEFLRKLTEFNLADDKSKDEADSGSSSANKEVDTVSSLKDTRTLSLFKLILPDLEPYLSPSDLINCRLVCRQWNTAVKQHLDLNSFNRYSKIMKQKEPDTAFGVIVLRSLEDLERLIANCSRHRASGRNPFLFRFLRVHEPPTSNVKEHEHFWNTLLTQLLRPLGHHLWYFHLFIRNPLPLPTVYCCAMLAMVSHLMNAKALHIHSEKDWASPPPNGPTHSEVITMASCLQLMTLNPMQKMIRLEELVLSRVPPPIIMSLMSAAEGPLMRILEINSFYFYCVAGVATDFATIMPLFPNLERFIWLPTLKSDGLNGLSEMGTPLKQLKLQLVIQRSGGITLPKLLDTMNKFGGTLTELELTLVGVASYDGTGKQKGLRLQLPLLRRLSWGTNGMILMESVDFIVELKALQRFFIDISMSDTRRKVRGQIIKFSGFIDRMHESNVWDLLPELTILDIASNDKFYQYGREKLPDQSMSEVWHKSSAITQ